MPLHNHGPLRVVVVHKDEVVNFRSLWPARSLLLLWSQWAAQIRHHMEQVCQPRLNHEGAGSPFEESVYTHINPSVQQLYTRVKLCTHRALANGQQTTAVYTTRVGASRAQPGETK